MTDQRGAVRRFRRVRSCLGIFMAVAMTSCGGSQTSPTPAPPTPRFPSTVGNWSGTLTIDQVETPGGSRLVTVCNETWAVTTQIEGQFTGTFQATGGCAGSGSMKGTVSTSGEVTGLTFNPHVGSPGSCLLEFGDGIYAGVLNGGALTARTAERAVCHPPVTGLITFDRSFTLSMRKQ